MTKKRLTREESQQQTRRQLLNVAAKMFAERGFYESSVDRIAEAAGFSKGAVYSNFGSKEDLFIEVFREHQAKEVQNLEEIAQSCETMTEFVKLIEANHEQGRIEEHHRSVLKLEFLLHAMRHEKAQESLAEILAENRQQMEKLLDYFYKKSGATEPLSVDKLAYLLLSVDIGVGIQAYIGGEDIPEGTLSEGLNRLLNVK